MHSAFAELAQCCQQRDLIDTLVDIAVESEALSFLALKLLCNLAVDPVVQRMLGMPEAGGVAAARVFALIPCVATVPQWTWTCFRYCLV